MLQITYKEEQDLIGTWISECCETSSSKETTTEVIYANYVVWSAANGLRPDHSLRLRHDSFESRHR
jgi:phage/plasmid-associated DNA primase